MKTLRYLLITIGLVSVLSICAQALAQQPEAEMQSTSVMVGSGSSLPQAANTGAILTGSTPGSYAPARRPGDGPRRGASGEDGGDTPPDNPHGPNEEPLGDVLWPLMALACAYLIMRVVRRRTRTLSR